MLKKNVGGADRVIRVVAGVILLGLFFAMPEAPWRYWTLIGIIPLVTGLFGTCPLYSILGVSTCPAKRA